MFLSKLARRLICDTLKAAANAFQLVCRGRMNDMHSAVRTAWMDRARAFAILTVVLCHAVEIIQPFQLEVYTAANWPEWLMRFALFTLGRLGVPLFLGLTGALLLPRDYSGAEQLRGFYRKNFVRLLVCVECWMVLYSFFLVWYHDLPLDWRRMAGAMTATGQLQLGHLWYMPMILGMYLLLPFAARAVQGLSVRTVLPVMAITFAYVSLLPSLNLVLEVFSIAQRESLLDLGFSGGVYGLYILGGWLIGHKKALAAWPGWMTRLCFAAGYVLTVLFQLWRYHMGFAYKVWYDFAILMLTGFFLFELFRRSGCKKPGLDRLCLYLSRRSFAVFLLHFPLQRVCCYYGCHVWLGEALGAQTAVVFVLSLAASLALISVFSRIPIIRRWLLYM